MMNTTRRSVKHMICAAVSIALLGPCAAYATQYSVTPLGSLGGSDGTYSAGIDSAGAVIGYSYLSGNTYENAVLYSNESLQDIIPTNERSRAIAISPTGAITGWAFDSTGLQAQAYLYSNGVYTANIGGLGGEFSAGIGINNNGEIVGVNMPNGVDTAFAYTPGGTTQQLGTFGGTTSFAQGVNSSGQVVGYATDSSGNALAFLYSNGAMQNLGTLGGATSTANAINTSGIVVGQADNAAGNGQAFVYSNGQMSDLGSLGGLTSNATALNDANQIVGSATNAAGSSEAFLYSNGTMQNLNSLIGVSSSLYTLQSATGINSNGQISVNGVVNATGENMAFLLTPVTSTASAGVPAPATAGLLLLSVLALWGAERRRRVHLG